MYPHRSMISQALRLGLVATIVVLALSACGGEKHQKSGPQPLPEDQKVLRPGEYHSEEFEPSFSFRVGKGWKNVPPEAFDILVLGRETDGFGAVNVQRVYEPSKSGTPIVVHTPKDLVGWLEHHPYLETSDPKTV